MTGEIGSAINAEVRGLAIYTPNQTCDNAKQNAIIRQSMPIIPA